MQMTVQEIRVQRVSILTSASFDTVVARIDADCQFEVGERAMPVAFATPRVCAVAVSQGVAGLQIDDRIEVGDCSIEVCIAKPSQSPLQVRGRVQRDRCLDRLNVVCSDGSRRALLDDRGCAQMIEAQLRPVCDRAVGIAQRIEDRHVLGCIDQQHHPGPGQLRFHRLRIA